MIEESIVVRTKRPHTGSYVRLFELARGGMGSVELALRREGSFSRKYAIKRLHPHFNEDASVRTMFVDEARFAGLIRHANVVSVLDVGSDGDGPFLVMDYVDGISVNELLKMTSQRHEFLPLQLALRIVTEAARGLHAAHELLGDDGRPLGLVHRDVSPQNLLVGFDGVTRVTDFGIAKALNSSSHTATGVLKGKIGYMSPESLRFEPLDRRADVFGLAVVLYELVSSKRLFDHRMGLEHVAMQILHEAAPDLGLARPELPSALVELQFEMLAKLPAQRPSTAQDVAERLEVILHELVAEEGMLDLGRYLRERFASQRSTCDERVRAAVDRIDQGLEPEKDWLSVEVQEKTVVIEPDHIRRRNKRRFRSWGIAGVTLVLASVATVVLGIRNDAHDLKRPIPPRASSAPPPSLLPAGSTMTPTPTLSETPPALQAPEPTTIIVAPPPTKTTTRWRSRRRKPASKTNASSIPRWDW